MPPRLTQLDRALRQGLSVIPWWEYKVFMECVAIQTSDGVYLIWKL